MICKNCNKENVAGAKFCFACGTKLEAMPAEPTQQFAAVSDNVICKNCHNSNKAGIKYCGYCGADLSENTFSERPKEDSNFDVTIPAAKVKKSKAPLIIILILLIIAGAVAVLLIFNPFDSDSDNTEETNTATTIDGGFVWNGGESFEGVLDATQSQTVIVTEPEETENPGVMDLTSTLDRGQHQALLGKIGAKESITGLTIKFEITNNLTHNAESYANERCVLQCKEDGIYAVVDAKNKTVALATIGRGEKYLSADTNRIVKGAGDYLKNKNYYELCTDIIDSILDSERFSRFEAVEGAEQVIYVVKNSGSNTGKLTLVEWVDGYEEVLYEVDKVYLGMDGITDTPSETKSATPKGTFKLGFAFSDRKLNTKLDSRIIESGDVWVDDSNSKYYNTLQHGSTSNSKWSSAENTYYAFSSNIFDACILIEHNGDGYEKGVSGKGSCIYLSGKNKELSTSYGDVNVSASQMETLLSYLDEAKNPHIVIR